LVAQFRIGRDDARHRIRIFDFARGKSHGVGLSLCSRLEWPAQAKTEESSRGVAASDWGARASRVSGFGVSLKQAFWEVHSLRAI
jgi:hypothetical protein